MSAKGIARATKRKTFADKLVDLHACEEAREWVGTRSLVKAWEECERGDWMLWLAARNVVYGGALHRTVVLAAVECARPALKFVPAGEKRPAEALRVAAAWARGKATIEQVRSAADAAAAAASAHADAAYAPAAAAVYAAYAPAAAASAYDAARKDSLARSARIVRKHIKVVRGKLVPA